MNGDDFKYEDVIRAPAHHSNLGPGAGPGTGYGPPSSLHYTLVRPTTGDSMFTSPSGYADSESGYSLESRFVPHHVVRHED